MTKKKIGDIIKEHADKLMVLPGVVGIGAGESQGKPCILIFVQDEEADSLKDIPNTIEGYPIILKKSGEFTPRK
ncbi:hypothetical protein ACFLWR_05705 [Chloroflexota bacterium]